MICRLRASGACRPALRLPVLAHAPAQQGPRRAPGSATRSVQSRSTRRQKAIFCILYEHTKLSTERRHARLPVARPFPAPPAHPRPLSTQQAQLRGRAADHAWEAIVTTPTPTARGRRRVGAGAPSRLRCGKLSEPWRFPGGSRMQRCAHPSLRDGVRVSPQGRIWDSSGLNGDPARWLCSRSRVCAVLCCSLAEK